MTRTIAVASGLAVVALVAGAARWARRPARPRAASVAGPGSPALRPARPPRLTVPSPSWRRSDEDAAGEERAHQAFMHYFAELEGARTKAPPDPDWSLHAEQLIRSFAAGDSTLTGVGLEGVACGSTLCRVELRIDDQRVRRRAPSLLHRRVGRELPQMTLHSVPGADLSIIYLARAGTSLPPMDHDDLEAIN